MRDEGLDPGKVLTVDEARALIDRYAEPETDDERLQRIFLRLGLGTGLRASELAALRLEDLHLDRLILRVRNGKGSRSRTVKIPQSLADDLRRWIADERPETEAREVLVSDRAAGFRRKGLWRRFARACREAGLPPERCAQLSTHSMRHYYATRSLELGKSIPWVRDQLGHASADTTSRYLSVADIEANGAVDVV